MEWKRIVRYMYEYENGRKIRNTGFVRFDCNDRICKAYIHGKGIQAEETCNIYAFYESAEAVIRIPLGYVRMQNRNLSGYVEMDCAHVGNTDIPFERILGLMIGEDRKRRYMVFLRNEQEVSEIRENELHKEPECAEKPEHVEEERSECQEHTEELECRERQEHTEEPECGESSEHTEEPERSEKSECMEPPEEELPPESEEVVTEELDYRRIGPRELGCLGRRERHLVNNSFLLHGYYNYRHLILAEEGSQYVLGVPGVFMEKEKRAAEMFGFPDFLDAKEYGMTVPTEAEGSRAAFGYWCRRLGKE